MSRLETIGYGMTGGWWRGGAGINAAWRAWVNQFEFQRPLMVTPKTAMDRIQIPRTAMQTTLSDGEFLAEAKKSKMLVDNVAGEDTEKSLDAILSIAPSVKTKLEVLWTKRPGSI